MRAIQYKSGTQSGPFSQSEMDDFARMLRVDQPDFQYDEEYAAFMQANNGGEPLEKFFRAGGQWYEVERFLNFADASQAGNDDSLYNVQQNWNLIEDRVLTGIFPFASLPGGNYLVLDHSEGQPGTVSIWYHELSTEDNPHLIPAADDFASFINSLQTTPS